MCRRQVPDFLHILLDLLDYGVKNGEKLGACFAHRDTENFETNRRTHAVILVR